MKRTIAWILLFVLLFWMLTGCDRYDSKYKPSRQEGDYKWVCDEMDMWFLRVKPSVKRSKNLFLLGELNLNSEIMLIDVNFQIGGETTVYEFSDFDDLSYSVDKMCFCGMGHFHEGWFTVNVYEEYVDYVGFDKLTFRRVELDEDDFAWIETNYPELLPDEDEIGAEQTEAP